MKVRLSSGQSLIEILIAVGIFLISMATVGVLFLDASQTSRRGSDSVEARQFAIEGLEAARAIRNASFANLTAGTKGLAVVGGQWTFSGTSDTQDGFTRSLTISAPDADTRYVTSTVTWTSGGQTESTSVFTLLTDWTLSTGGTTWSTPTIAATTTLPGNVSALAVHVDETRKLLYVTTPVNAAGPEFWIYDITTETSPVLRGSVELGAAGNFVVSSGTLAYVAKSNNQVNIINTASTTAPSIAGTITLSTPAAAVNGLAIDKNQLHLVTSVSGAKNTYQIWNVTNPASPALLGSFNTSGGADIALKPSITFAFISAMNNTQELQDILYAVPASLGVGGSIDLPGTEDMTSIAVSGTIAYQGSLLRATAGEFFVDNITNPTGPTSLGSLEIGANVNHLVVHATTDSVTSAQNNLVFAATASTSKQFMVFNVTTSSSPTIFGTSWLPGTATGIDMTTSTVYVTTNNTAAGLMILTQ